MRQSSRRSRRHRNPHTQDVEQQPFFSPVPVQAKTDQQPFFQPKLSIGRPGDKYEQEADAVAEQVVNGQGQAPAVQRKGISAIQRTSLATPLEDEKLGTAEARVEKDKLVQEKPEVQRMESEEEEPVQMMEGEEEEVQMQEEEEEPVQMMEGEEEEVQMMEGEEEVQMKAETGSGTTSPGLGSRIKNTVGKGRPLPGNTRAEMETAFGVNFGGVNIHTDSQAMQMNKELGAQAFTHGKDVYFNSGKYRPESTEGKRLLAHELTHVVQQGNGGHQKKNVQKSPDPSLFHIVKKALKFAAWWSNFPSGTAEDVKKQIGGKVDAAWINNTCAIRMSRVMNYAGFPISYQKGKTISGADKMWYYFRIKDLKPFIESQLGAPDYTFAPPYDMSELSSIRGIILFDVKVWSDATGHFTLWNGTACADKCYFDEASKVYIWVP
mgnify:CR=1 FL=1